MKKDPVVYFSLTEPAVEKLSKLSEEVFQRAEVIELDVKEEPLFKMKEILAPRRRGKGYKWLSVMEGKANHEAEGQSTIGFLDRDGTIPEALYNYTIAHGL